VRQRESLKLARAELQQQMARTEHPARVAQIEQAIGEIDKRLTHLTSPSAPEKKSKK
jgi:hypothetical protein